MHLWEYQCHALHRAHATVPGVRYQPIFYEHYLNFLVNHNNRNSPWFVCWVQSIIWLSHFQGPYTREDGFLGYNEICEKQIQDAGPGPGWRVEWEEAYSAPFMFRIVLSWILKTPHHQTPITLIALLTLKPEQLLFKKPVFPLNEKITKPRLVN